MFYIFIDDERVNLKISRKIFKSISLPMYAKLDDKDYYTGRSIELKLPTDLDIPLDPQSPPILNHAMPNSQLFVAKDDGDIIDNPLILEMLFYEAKYNNALKWENENTCSFTICEDYELNNTQSDKFENCWIIYTKDKVKDIGETIKKKMAGWMET